jgi:uncharacterized protein (DUF39 family)
MFIKTFFKDLTTEDDGVHYSGAKVTAYTSVASYLGMAAYALHKDATIDPSSLSTLGSGLAMVLAGAGALIAGTQATMNKPPMSKPGEEHVDPS